MITRAILKIKSDAQVTIGGNDIDTCTIDWHDGNPTNITREQIKTKLDETNYQRDRAAEYPSLKEFAEAYTEKEILADATKWDEYVIKYNKVRSDNPK